MSNSSAVPPAHPAELVSTSMLRPRASGEQAYAAVSFDSRVEKVAYRVFQAKNGDPQPGVHQSGELHTKLPGANHAFVIPVCKGMVYFVEVTMSSGKEGCSPATLTWLYDPFKRRAVTREELAPKA